MPKVAVDFSKTVVYHFVCKDQTITCEYVGSTTNFNKRKGKHKSNCHAETNSKHHLKVYQIIRNNGGWDNWDMKPLEEFPCENKTQQLIREQYWIDKLKPDMNCKSSVHDRKEWYEANKEVLAEKAKVYLESNKEVIAEKKKVYYEENKEIFAEKRKVYYEANKDLVLEKAKVYYEENKEVLVKRKKAFYEANKDKLLEQKNKKITCECGVVYCLNHKARHEKSMKHQAKKALTLA